MRTCQQFFFRLKLSAKHMEKILVPTDFSAPAANALSYAIRLAQELNARVDLCHVYNIPFNDTTAVPPEYIQQLLNEKRKWVKEQFDLLMRKIPAAVCGTTKSIFGVFTAVEISELAEQENYDYIVMGTKGSQNSLGDLMGSITSKVILKSPCPLIAIPTEARYKPISSITYATSLEPTDEHAMQQLMTLAGKLGVGIHFVHVNTRSNEGIRQVEQKVSNYVENYTDFTVINNFSVSNGLEEFAELYGMDLLALYVPNRRLLERIFHKSFSKQMALHSKVPLIVFHE